MRKKLSVFLASLLCVSLLAGCGGDGNSNNNSNTVANGKYQMIDTDLKVGMATDAGNIDDRSFNQNTWEGIAGSVKNCKYIRPAGETDADYIEAIGNLYDAGYRFIVLPGYKFERAVYEVQNKYPDAKFVILDGTAVDGSGNEALANNTVGIYFAEQQGGFLAGVAAAVEIQKGNFGFIGGMEIPSVMNFEAGFEQGIQYANENLGTNITLNPQDVVYQGSFDDKAGGQQIAAQMYDRGVKVIFTAAGGTGIGAITEAKSRAATGNNSVYVIGVDIDQYEDGIYDTSSNGSVVLTSAMKYLDRATIDMIQDEINGQFKGGQIITLTVANGGIGIPEDNPNLSESTLTTLRQVLADLQSGEIIVNAYE